MDKQKDPKGFLVVLPGEIIKIPQDSEKSWLTLFYSLPRELAEKWRPAYELPRCPYEVLRTDKYDHIVCDDMFKLLVWDATHGAHGSSSKSKTARAIIATFPAAGISMQGIFPCGGCRTASSPTSE